jgi:hypothetical protein
VLLSAAVVAFDNSDDFLLLLDREDVSTIELTTQCSPQQLQYCSRANQTQPLTELHARIFVVMLRLMLSLTVLAAVPRVKSGLEVK